MYIELTQNRIRNIVGGYKELFPQEYEATVNFIADNRRLQENEFASLKKEQNMLERALFELPETLDTMLIKELSTDELTWFKSKTGGRWFAKSFPQFALAVKI